MYDDQAPIQYEQMRSRSKSGEVATRTKEKTIKMKLSSYKRRVRAIAIAVAATTILAIGGGTALVHGISNTLALEKLSNDFNIEVIIPARYDDYENKQYGFHYDEIANYIKQMENQDEGIYYCARALGNDRTDKVLYWLGYDKPFDIYVREKGFDSIRDYGKAMEKEILSQEKIKNTEEELSRMQQEHHTNTNDNSFNLNTEKGK